jgi:hypothetical protein
MIPAFAAALLRRGRRLRSCAATADKSLGQGRARLGFVAAWTVAFVISGGGARVLACPMCFGAEETSMLDGTRLGVLVLLTIILGLQGAFVGFFIYLRKRAKDAAEAELDTEWSELQGASRTP